MQTHWRHYCSLHAFNQNVCEVGWLSILLRPITRVLDCMLVGNGLEKSQSAELDLRNKKWAIPESSFLEFCVLRKNYEIITEPKASH